MYPSSSTSTPQAGNRYGYQAQEWADQPLGAVFAAYRQAYGKTVEDVAKDLCLRRAHVRALESGDLSELPAQSYATGFVRSYAKYLGLPPEDMVSRFRDSYIDQPTKVRMPRQQMRTPSATVAYSPRWPSFAVLVISALLLGSAYMVMSAYTAVTNPGADEDLNLEFLGSGSVQTPQTAATSDLGEDEILILEDIDPITLDSSSALIYGTPRPLERPVLSGTGRIQPEPISQSHRVIIRATGRAYLKLWDHETGTPFLAAEYQRGDEYAVPDGKIVRLFSLDVARIELLIDGVSYAIAPAIAALNDPIVIDPDVIAGSTQLIRNINQ